MSVGGLDLMQLSAICQNACKPIQHDHYFWNAIPGVREHIAETVAAPVGPQEEVYAP